ncbi:MAG: hypothetical protein IJN08_05150 [Clostridia bacterium]|nr:hypothetical protein [Clostridia bacterium]
MKYRTVLMGLLSLLALLFWGCAGAGRTPPEEPIQLSSFTFMARGMSTADIYSYTAQKAEVGIHLHLELNCGYNVIDVTVEEDVLGELGAIADLYRLDTWDGFDKKSRRVSDGEGFTLQMTTEDGRSIYASGSNKFPDNYREARQAIDELFQKYMEVYG